MARLTEQLAAIREQAAALGGGMLPTGGATLDPRLVTTYAPRWLRVQQLKEAAACLPAPPEVPPGPWDGPEAPEGASGAAPGGAADGLSADPPEGDPLGLSADRNSKTSRRFGINGIPDAARRQVQRSICLLEERRPQLAFWTITLPPEAMATMQELDAWPAFQDRIRKELARRLKLAGLVPEVIGVAELHPQRTRQTGRPCPHLHVVYVARKTRWHHWAIDRWQLDFIIAAAFRTATGQGMRLDAAGNVQKITKSARKYLSHYLKKQPLSTLRHPGTSENGLPRQWWFSTERVRFLLRNSTARFPAEFVIWLHEHREGLTELGRLRCGKVENLAPGAPNTYWVLWRSPPDVAQTLEDWALQMGLAL